VPHYKAGTPVNVGGIMNAVSNWWSQYGVVIYWREVPLTGGNILILPDLPVESYQENDKVRIERSDFSAFLRISHSKPALFFVDDYTQDNARRNRDTSGLTFIADGLIVVRTAGFSDQELVATVAHEFGHLLLGTPGHNKRDPRNIMYEQLTRETARTGEQTNVMDFHLDEAQQDRIQRFRRHLSLLPEDNP
jgi:hypothetical protein